jgi:hypothetical protein
MKLGKIAITAVVLAVFMFLTDWLWFGMLMKDSMTPIPNARTEYLYVWMGLGMLIYGFAFAYIFVMGRGSGSAVSEGVRFGFWATLFAWVPMGFVWYGLTSATPMSEYLTEDVFRLVQMMIMGIMAGYLTTVGHRGDDSRAGKGTTGGDD